MSRILVELKNIDAAYSGKNVLKDVSLKIYSEDFIGVIGPNGGGKTTLLNIILGLLKPGKGSIARNIEKSDIGFLPQVNQFDNQFPITVSDVVLSGMTSGFNLRKRKNAFTDEKVKSTLLLILASRFKPTFISVSVSLGAASNLSILSSSVKFCSDTNSVEGIIIPLNNVVGLASSLSINPSLALKFPSAEI